MSDEEELGNLIEFPTSHETEEYMCVECEGEWFQLLRAPGQPTSVPLNGALAFTNAGSVRAFAGQLVCIECGKVQSPFHDPEVIIT